MVPIKREALLGDVYPLYVFDQEEGADDNICRYTNSVEMIGAGSENSATDVLSE